MKKIIILLASVMLFTVGCSKSSETPKTSVEDSQIQTESVQTGVPETEAVSEVETSMDEELMKQLESAALAEMERALKESMGGTGEEPVMLDIEERELVNQDEVKIVLKGITLSGDYGCPEMKLYIENNTDHEISVYAEDMSVNDFAFYSNFGTSISAGKKLNSAIYIGNDQLEDNGLTSETIDNIEFVFEVLDSTDDMDCKLMFDTDIIKIEL